MLKITAAGIVAAALSAPAVIAAPQTYETPEAAVSAVVDALEARDRSALLAVFGPENEDVIISGNDERDHEDGEDFLSAYRAMNRVAVDGQGVATLYIGREQWPFPLRLVKVDAGWAFDVESGREEMLDCRIDFADKPACTCPCTAQALTIEATSMKVGTSA